MKRYLENYIYRDLAEKIVLLMGPRQSGKTVLSRSLTAEHDYFNYDSAEDRLALMEKSWDRQKQLIIFDEIHKMENWKQWLKGIIDKESIPPSLLVTGSARLDMHRKVGDSLAGRHFSYRLHPLDLKEANQYWKNDPEEIFERLWNCSGFPEPFLKGSVDYYRRWRRSHIDIILRQDLIDLHSVHDIKSIETLVALLKTRIGSTVSFANLARDLERDPHTIKRWLQLLENLYIIFRVTPYSKNIARSLLKEPKFYFYDCTYVDGDQGAKLENIVACSLLKELQYLEDIKGIKANLHYLRTKDGNELDFLICLDENPTYMIEVKFKDDSLSKHFSHFSKQLPNTKCIQLVKDINREKTYATGEEVRSLITWLTKLDFSKVLS